MYKFYKGTVIDFDRYESLLMYRPYLVYNYKLMRETLEYEKCRVNTLFSLAVDTMIYRSGGVCTDLSTNCVLNYLLKYENCPERYFNNRKTQSYSLDSKKVLEKLKQNGHAVEFIEYYTKYKSLKSRCDKIQKLLERCVHPAGVNQDGIELRKIHFHTHIEKNFRFNYSDSDVIAIPKEYNSCISIDDGYFLAWGDFAQSDFRIAYNLFMRSPQNDELMNSYEDKYEALARMVANVHKADFDYDKFKEERQSYKTLTLAVVYGTRDSVIAEEQPFIRTMTQFLNNCEKYKEYEKRIKDRIALGLPIVIDSYFGNSQGVNKTRDVDLLNDALNTPVQTGTSEIVALTTMAILDEFYKLGYSEEDVSVYYVRHDEPVFRVSKKAIKDAWIFNQFNKILIDDWTPLSMDFNFGFYYKEKDEALTEEIHNVYKSNLSKLDNIPIGTTINNFYPISPVFTLCGSCMQTPDGNTIYCFYSPEFHAVQYNLQTNANNTDTNEFVEQVLAKLEIIIYKKGFRGIRFKVDFMENSEAFSGNSYIGIQLTNDNSMSMVNILCRYMYCRYCKKHDLDYDETVTPYERDAELINSVRDLTEVLEGTSDE